MQEALNILRRSVFGGLQRASHSIHEGSLKLTRFGKAYLLGQILLLTLNKMVLFRNV